MARNYPHPIPNGWFLVCYDDELAPGEVKTVQAFGDDLVVFRTASGAVRASHAYCPHLGAHLGCGGRVEGETLRCPFHGWRFGADGECVEIPYSKRIPPRARLDALPTLVRNRGVFVWRHAEGKPPAFEVPVLSYFDEPGWQGPRRFEWLIRTQYQEMLENIFDPAHFHVVHGAAAPTQAEVEFDGPAFRVMNHASYETPGGRIEGTFETHTVGPGFGWVHYRLLAEIFHTVTILPVDADHIRLRLAFYVKSDDPKALVRGMPAAMIAGVTANVAQDIALWEPKRYLAKPLLCDGDGPLLQVREWAKQFHSE
jgi:phenylpropionate dioxygenase-like ring-hydroxylating dioxygenase large terminal subunit